MLKTKDGRTVNIGQMIFSVFDWFPFRVDFCVASGGKAAVKVGPGDSITIHSPGGGGFGKHNEGSSDSALSSTDQEEEIATGVPYRVGGSVIEYQRLMESA